MMQVYKYEQIIEKIQNEITSNNWKPGSQIPSERDLVVYFDVSRITIKKALQELVSRGVLVRYPQRRGTFVHAAKEEAEERPSPAKLIGVAIDDVSDRFGSTLLRGIEDFLWNQRIHTVICNGDRDFKKVEDYFQSLLQNNIDGVILSPVITEESYQDHNRNIIKLLQEKNVPFVLVDRNVAGIDANYVSSNHRESTYNLTKALIARGHRKNILLKGLPCSSMEEREAGYLDAMHEAGISVPEKWIIQLNDNRLFTSIDVQEIEKLKLALRRIGTLHSIVVLNNRLLKGFITAMNLLSEEWYNDIVIALHDQLVVDLPCKERVYQIIQPDYEVGKEAARLLTQTIEEKLQQTRQIVLQSKIVLGQE
ncbi:GntR family transcriptional regulator [Sediminispirochaeta bajacaliforniensis]|uniref:GntR family transcriptional regulator n=1 Tax=Sediminispirochaeta bajacaliforniensis TaxID=148 RepID=UPI00036B66D7|nr:GntR family transcriptional regulator [Sediminispirochaeta bajacaliforniensis]